MRKKEMKLTGVGILAKALPKLEPDTMLIVVSDKDGKKKYIKIDSQSMADSELILRVETNPASRGARPQSGCYVWNGVRYVWTNPCP
jgi:hypothetical protein